MEDFITEHLLNIEEHVTVDILESVDKAVEKVIKNYRKKEDGAEDVMQEIQFLATHPRETLKSFHTFLKIAKTDNSEIIKDESQPDLVPKQPFNNSDLFNRMPAGFTRVEPKNLEDLIKIVQNAADGQRSIKAVGSCYAFSNVAFSNGVILEMNKHLHNILPIDESLLKNPSRIREFCQMEAGTLIESILEELWPLDCRDKTEGYRTMLNQTGYSGLSIAGTTGTSAHGSGIDKPPMPDCIESIHLVTVDKSYKVVQFRIEPTNGITNAKKFKAKHKNDGITLIQNDKTFYATTVHVGSMGVIYSYIIRVQPAFYLEEHRTIMNWENLSSEIPNLIQRNLKKPTDPDYLHSFEVWVSPYPPLYDNTVYGVVSKYRLAKPPKVGKRPFSFYTCQMENELIRLLTVTVSKHLQRLLPLVMFFALWTTVEREPVTMPSTEALSFGSPNGVPVLVSDNGIDATDPQTPIKAVNEMIQSYNDALQEDNRFFTTAPFSMRFTSASKSFLAMQYKRRSCMIETPILLDTFGQLSTLRRARALTQNSYASRPHWGQNNEMTSEKLKELYPESYKNFIKVYKRFNVSSLFSNYFTKDFDIPKE